MAILEKVNSPVDLKKLSMPELNVLASEIRQEIIKVTAKNGGHLAPSLGVVELTLALHYVFDAPKDKIIWDVGHQSYTHKLVTGRKERFATLRTSGGLSGFPKRQESVYDVFDTGHSGNSVSVALGLANGAKMMGESFKTIAVIGDGSIVTGMAFEALNNAGIQKSDLMVVLNDNEMSIAKSNGAIATHLNRIITGQLYNRVRADVWNLLGHLPRNISGKARLAAKKLEEGLKNLIVPSVIFEELGFRYIGPIKGHNLGELITTFQRLKKIREPILVHVVTKKGKGYAPAELQPEIFHGIGPFDTETGVPRSTNPSGFTKTFGESLIEAAQINERVVVITAGMCLGAGLEAFRRKFPDRHYDVGICEQHAVTFAAGLALSGLKPIVAIYSTFLARAYDQLIQDVCLQRLPVVLAIDRAGLVGEDGPTHHGQFDLSYLRLIPNLVVMAPKDEAELNAMLQIAIEYDKGPIAIRYPKARATWNGKSSEIKIGKAEVLCEGEDGCVLAIGSTVLPIFEVCQNLLKSGIKIGVVNARFVKPLDQELLLRLANRFNRFITIEENVMAGGFGSAIMEFFNSQGLTVRIKQLGLADYFIEHGKREELLNSQGLSGEKLARTIQNEFGTSESLTSFRDDSIGSVNSRWDK
ncbi:MAG: 1-deoxy-D-xylulose-5-phosphate synthase [candidate division WOR-3 bacterium]|nr:1-deoxy-D-xylulose-5-phosphate synthase [candidate division WOR-3 bacterium]MDH5683298.1 1-deoxy-D-xylulose-5-phosphate synthase [candidate division WOR-3 bacterium]